MADQASFLAEIDAGSSGGIVHFKSPREAFDFISSEAAFWQTLSNNSGMGPFQQITSTLQSIRDELNSLREDQATPERVTQLLRSAYAGAAGLPTSSSAAAKLIEQIGARHGVRAAAAAAAMAVRSLNGSTVQSPVLQSQDAIIGAILYALGAEGITTASAEAAAHSYSELKFIMQRDALAGDQRMQTALDGFERLVEQARELARSEVESFLEKSRLQQDERVALANKAAADVLAEANGAVASLNATEKAYIEQMGLQAPVAYWNDRAVQYRNEARLLLLGVIVYFLCLVGGGAWLFIANQQAVATYILEFKDSPGSLFVVSAGAAILASIPLWGARLLVRFYLSAHHLSSDAKERKTMTQTYLALTKETAAGKEDRAIILAALFRNTQDGVVKDAAAPETSVGGLIAKLLDR